MQNIRIGEDEGRLNNQVEIMAIRQVGLSEADILAQMPRLRYCGSIHGGKAQQRAHIDPIVALREVGNHIRIASA